MFCKLEQPQRQGKHRDFSCPLQGIQPGQLSEKLGEIELGKEAQTQHQVFMGRRLYARFWGRCGGHGKANLCEELTHK